MRTKLIIFAFVIPFLLPAYSKCQSSEDKDIMFKDGLYLSYLELKSNNPSIPNSDILLNTIKQMTFKACFEEVRYIKNGQTEVIRKTEIIKASDVWAICINGRPYVKYNQPNNDPFRLASEKCFYKLYHIGSISRYFVEREGKREIFFVPNTNPNLGTTSNYSHQNENKIVDFALNIETGEIFNQNTKARQIIEIIRTDEYFKDVKIKKRDLGIYINEYNKRNPLRINQE